jgi:hypothetical protein
MRLATLSTTAPANPGRRQSLHGLCCLTLIPLAALSACGTTSGGPSASPWPHPAPRPGGVVPGAPGGMAPGAGVAAQPGAPSVSAPPTPTPIVTERRWLEEWFSKTPVVISQPNDNTLQLSVPAVNSFEAGQTVPKPALAAVLDRVAESLRRQINTRLTVMVAPDADARAAQAINRGQRVVEHLVSRRVPTQRIVTPRVTEPGAPVVLQLQFLAPPPM